MDPSDYSIQNVNSGVIGEESEAEVERKEDRKVIRSHLKFLLLESGFLSSSRKTWSSALLCCVIASIVFQFVLSALIGYKNIDFKGYETFLSIVAGGAFAQVVGLAAIALKWIFGGKRPDEMLHELRTSLNR